jgi:outer membrane biosynthesis protein TonB
MKLPAKIVLWLLPVFLVACHKQQQAQVQPLAPPVEDNPPPPPSTAPVNLPPPVVTIPIEPTKNAPTPPAKPPAKHRKPKKPEGTPVGGATQTGGAQGSGGQNGTQEASNPAPSPGVSAIGQLSSGDPANDKKETEDLIASTEHGLGGITRALNDTEQKTADQIREDLKEAKQALASGDVDGAHTLAEKAKVLLAELTQ